MFFASPPTPLVLVFLTCLAILILAAGAVACGGPEDTPTPTPIPLSITAIDLYSAKEGNEADWNLNYVDKRALISGEITSIEKAGSNYDVKLAAESKVPGVTGTVNPFTGEYTGADIVCKVDESMVNTVSQLQEGNEITVLASITNDGFIDLVVKDCSVR